MVGAAASLLVDLWFISQVKSYQKTLKNGIHSFPAWRSASRDSVEEKPAISLAVSLGKTLNGLPPSLCDRQMAEPSSLQITQPNVAAEYNYGMGGVDRFDQNIAAYMITQRSQKGWWPVFRFCVDLAVQNAYQIYRLLARGVSKKLDPLGFRRAIAEVYSKKYIKNSSGLFKHPQMCQNNEVRYDNVGHWIKKATQGRCQNKPCKGTTLYCCEKCTVALHPECFKAYPTC